MPQRDDLERRFGRFDNPVVEVVPDAVQENTTNTDQANVATKCTDAWFRSDEFEHPLELFNKGQGAFERFFLHQSRLLRRDDLLVP